MRRLATIRTIRDVRPIEGADAIELVFIDGWQCVSKKNEFMIGNKCIYFEIDSFLPVWEEFEFLRKSSYKKMVDGTEGFRLKSIKLRGQISQGLALPISKFPEVSCCNEGDDVTDVLSVKKYEPPIPACLSGQVKGMFPTFIPKTDQERIQNFDKQVHQWERLEFEVTEKLDGSSCTIYFDLGEFGVCSRTINLLESDDNSLWKIAKHYDLETKMKQLKRSLGIQGEIIGEGIQGNKYKIRGQEFYVFDIYDIETKSYLGDEERREITKTLGLKDVPLITRQLLTGICNVESILTLAVDKSVLNKDVEREGIVFKQTTKIPGRVSFKAISNKFLLKHGE